MCERTLPELPTGSRHYAIYEQPYEWKTVDTEASCDMNVSTSAITVESGISHQLDDTISRIQNVLVVRVSDSH